MNSESPAAELDLRTLLSSVPRGEWAMISEDGKTVLAHNPNKGKVLEVAPEGHMVFKD